MQRFHEGQPNQPETEPYKGVFLMGDKGGKKDKKKKDKEPKKLT